MGAVNTIEATPSEAQIDVRNLKSAVLRHRFLLLSVAIPLFVVMAVTIFLLPSRYTATSSIAIEPRQEQVTKTASVLSDLPNTDNIVDSEATIIKSRATVHDVVSNLKLTDDPEFNTALRPKGLLSTVKGWFSNSPATTKAGEVVGTEAVVSSLLDVSRVGLTYVIEVKFISEEPDKAAKIANAFADTYIQGQVLLRSGANDRANNFLGTRLSGLRDQVLAADNAVQQYKISNNLLSTSGVTLTEQEISELNQRLAEAQTAEAEQEARLATAEAQVRAGNHGDEVGEALASPVIQQLRQQRAQATQALASVEQRYGPKHPAYQRALDEVNAVDQQIQSELNRILSNLKAQVQIAARRTSSVQASLSGAHGTLVTNNKADVRLNELQRSADSSRSIYDGFLQRYRETASQAGMEETDARIVARAEVPSKPSSPKRLLLLIAAFVLSGLVGLAAVVARRLLDSSLATTDDISHKLGLTPLGTIPELSSIHKTGIAKVTPLQEIVVHPRSVFSEAFRGLRGLAVQPALDRGPVIVAMTSALPGEGKTTATACLGRSLALSEMRVLMIDCDLIRHTLADTFGATATKGLHDLVAGRATLDEALVIDPDSGASLLLAGAGDGGFDIFASEAFKDLLAALRSRFEVVLLDTPPVLALADARRLAALADITIHIVHWRKTPLKAIQRALELLAAQGAHVQGVALSHVNLLEQARTGYGDAGYYYKSYQRYYAA